ncbi:MAG: acyl-CoA thioesterase [Solirubrobacteraceae bacterium]
MQNPNTSAGGEQVSFALRVRYHECDMQGIVFNATHFAYADMASFELWRAACGSYQELVDRGLETTVAAARAVFHAPARFDDELTLDVRVSRIGTTSLELTTTARRDGTPVSEVAVTYVFVDRRTFEKSAPPDDLRECLTRYLEPGS